MLIKLIRFCRGYVDFCAKGKFPERFMNITSRYGINLWNATPQKGGISGSMYLSDYRKIRIAARKSKVRVHITGRTGMPFIISGYKQRIGLGAGIIASVIIILILSNFIWSVKIVGTNTISDTYLHGVLADNGISVGAYKNGLDVESIERKISLKIPEISWMSINITGNVINVEIKEKSEKPPIDTGTKPCNIKARRDGVITKIKASNGTTKVLKGSGVAKGDLLVSGLNETKLDTINYVRAKAEVFADVIENRQITIPKHIDYYSVGEKRANRNRLRFLWLDFPCSVSFECYDHSVNSTQSQNLYVNEVVLPVGVSTLTTYEIVPEPVEVSRKTAEQIVCNDVLLYELFAKPDSSTVKREITLSESSDAYKAKIDYVFNEDIAQSVEFDVTE